MIFSDDFSSGLSGWTNQFGGTLEDTSDNIPNTAVSGGELVHTTDFTQAATIPGKVRSGTAKNFSTVSLDNDGDYLELKFDAQVERFSG